MKKILASVLALACAFSAFGTAMASESVEIEADTAPAEMQIAQGVKTSHYGTVAEIGEGYITLNESDLKFNTDAYTYVTDYNLNLVDNLKAGDEVIVIANTATTRSIPAQTYAKYILVKTDDTIAPPIYVTIASNEDGTILSDDDMNRIVYSDETEIISPVAKIALRAPDLRAGSEIFVYASVVGMSLPAHVPAEKIVVMMHAQEEATTDVTESELPAEDVAVDEDTPYSVVVEEDIVIDFPDLPLNVFADGESLMIPLRRTAEALGLTVSWDSSNDTITVMNGDNGVVLMGGDMMISVIQGDLMTDGALSAAPQIHQGCTYVAADFFELFGKTVHTFDSAKVINIK